MRGFEAFLILVWSCARPLALLLPRKALLPCGEAGWNGPKSKLFWLAIPGGFWNSELVFCGATRGRGVSGSTPFLKNEEVDLRALLSIPFNPGLAASSERSALIEFFRILGLPVPEFCERLLALRLAMLPLMLPPAAGP